MFHYETNYDPASLGGQTVEQAQAWFEGMWPTASRGQQR
jgi:hypothetical protein